MHLTTTTLLTLALQATAALTTALFPHKVLDTRHSSVPGHITWHPQTANHTGDDPKTNTGITACAGPLIYSDASPARTTVVRNDCRHLLDHLARAPGFWEVHDRNRAAPLAGSGTCELAVRRLGAGGGANTTTIIGNQDAVRILNASVYDLAAAADEPYMDETRTQGRVSCGWASAARATVGFQIQLAGEGR